MSFAIPTTDLTGATTGTTGAIDWTQIAQSVGFPDSSAVSHLQLFNESPCELTLTMRTGEQYVLPAGGWQTYSLNAQCTGLNYQVQAVLNATPIVAKVLGTWYAPGEPVPNIPMLGNSPIGGTVSSANAQFLQGVGQTLRLTENDGGGDPVLTPAGGANVGVSLGAFDNVGNLNAFVLVHAFDGVNAAALFSGENVVVGSGNLFTIAGLTGTITIYNDEATVGGGIPSIVAISQATLVTATTLQTLISYTTPNDGNKHSYRISAYFLIANGTSGNNLTYQWSYTDFTGVARTDTGSMLGSTTGWGGGTSITNSRYTAYPAFFTANPNTTITVTFRDPTNTPHDTLSVFLERLS